MVLQFFRMSRGSRTGPPEAKASAAAPVVAFQGAGRVAWSARDTATLTRVGFLGNPVAFRCVKIIAEAAAAVPVVVQDADRRFDVHPVIDLLAAPNPGQSGAALMECFYGHLLLSGDGYLEAAGEVASGRAARALRAAVGPDEGGAGERRLAGGLRVRAGGQQHVFDMRQERVPVLHVKSFHPQDDHYGLSPLAAAASAIDVHNSAAHLVEGAARQCGAAVGGDRLSRARTGRGSSAADQYERLVEELETPPPGGAQRRAADAARGRARLEADGVLAERHGVSPHQGGGGAGRGAGLRGAADAARAAGRQYLCELFRGAPGVLPADGAAAGGEDAGGALGVAAGLLRRGVPG